MDVSDILSLIEIGITILVGYYITHRVSVRDTRTRMVKEYYISELRSIKEEVDSFFNKIQNKELDGRSISDWYGHQQQSLTSFDEGLRLSIPIRKELLEDVVNSIHETVTGSEYFNDHFKDEKYQLDGQETIRITQLHGAIDKAFNEYIVQINNSRQFYSWELVIQNFKFDYRYFKLKKKKCPFFNTLGLRLLKLIPYAIALALILIIGTKVKESYIERKNKELIEQTKVQSVQDSIQSDLVEQNLMLRTIIENTSNWKTKDTICVDVSVLDVCDCNNNDWRTNESPGPQTAKQEHN